MAHIKSYFFTIGIILTHTISPMFGPFIKDVLPHIAQHLDLVSQSRFVGMCRAGCYIDMFLHRQPILCRFLSTQDYTKILVHYAQENNKYMFQHIMTHENNRHKEQRVNVLTFFGYLNEKEVDLEIMKDLTVNMRAYQTLAKEKDTMHIDPALFCRAAHENRYIIIYIFIRNNMDVSYQNEEGNTALLLSVGKKNNRHVIDLLLSHGANINHANAQQRTALHLAAWYGNYHAVRKLLACNALIEAKDCYGDTPLQDALFQKHFKVARLLIKNKANINTQDRHRYTPLHIAAQKGNIDTLKFVIQNGAFIQSKNNESRTPLHLAVWDNHYNTAQLLLKHGALINEKDLFGDTPLHDVVIRNNQKIVQLLLINGADSSIKNTSQQTPLDIAKRRHSSKMVLLLEKHKK